MTLEQLRQSTGKSREDIAGQMGMTYHGVRRIERGGDTPVSTLEKLAEVLGTEFSKVHAAHRASRDNAQKNVN